jgi:hypothetical protein
LFFDLIHGQVPLLAAGVDERPLLRRTCSDDAGERLSIAGADRGCSIAFHDLPRGFQQRFNEMNPPEFSSHMRQIGADGATFPFHAVAVQARSSPVLPENLPSPLRIPWLRKRIGGVGFYRGVRWIVGVCG